MPRRNFPQKKQCKDEKIKEAKEKFEYFMKYLKRIKCFSQIPLRDLIAPDGYADNIACYFSEGSNRKVNISQLRKFFSEIKKISTTGEDTPEEAQKKIWSLYPIIAYAEGRKVIPNKFSSMLTQVLEKVDNCNKPKEYKMLGDFMTALVAYFKKYNPKDY